MFYINKPSIDYITVTTYSPDVFNYWYDRFLVPGDEIEPANQSKWENYAGIKLDKDIGTLFIGEGVQRKKQHYALLITSHLSEILFDGLVKMTPTLRQREREGDITINCTRIDIQCTVRSPDGWSQWNLQERLHDRGYLVWSVPSMSKSREFRTIYVGAKGSDRLIRVYQKTNDEDELFLRFEVQYRNNKAHGYAYQAFSTIRGQGEIGKAGILHQELLNLRDSHLTDVFGPAITSQSDDPIKLKREYTRSMTTRNWLTGQVLIALTRYIEQNPFDAELIDMFARVLFPPPEK